MSQQQLINVKEHWKLNSIGDLPTQPHLGGTPVKAVNGQIPGNKDVHK